MPAASKCVALLAMAVLALSLATAASAKSKRTKSAARSPVQAVQAPPPQQIFAAKGVQPLTPEIEQALKPKDSFKECDTCPEMVVVPKGTFIMGTPINEIDRDKGEDPLHQATRARPFAVGRFTVFVR